MVIAGDVIASPAVVARTFARPDFVSRDSPRIRAPRRRGSAAAPLLLDQQVGLGHDPDDVSLVVDDWRRR